jgi:beta-glucanase (GH16 family)
VDTSKWNRMYGAYTETFQVSSVAAGYKSAHLLWPSGTCDGCEDDFPENSWTDSISAFHHPEGDGDQDAFSTGASWQQWHTSMIVWTPGSVKFYLDGKLVGQSTRGVMNVPATWVLQNESALDGTSAAPDSSAQLNIRSVSVYSYTGA